MNQTFDYLLNAYDRAATADSPFEAGYAASRKSLLDHVCNLVSSSEHLRLSFEALRNDAEMYRHLRDRSKTQLIVWRPEDDGGATGPFDLGHLDAEIAAEIGCTPAVG